MNDDTELDDDLLLDDDEAETDAEPEQDDDDEPLLVAEADDDDEPSRYQKRINELTAQKQQARDEAIAERKRRQQYEQELAELRRIRAEAEAQTADTELEQAREALRTAYADDDVDKIAAAHERMTAAQVKRQTPRATEPEPAQADEAPELAPATQEWVERNPWFMDGEQHKARRDLALKINAELLAEGDLKPDANGFYRELDRRMKQRIEQQRGQGRKPAAAAVDRGGPHGDGRRMGQAEQGAYKRFLGNWQAKDSPAMRKAFAQRGKQAID